MISIARGRFGEPPPAYNNLRGGSGGFGGNGSGGTGEGAGGAGVGRGCEGAGMI